MGIHIEFDGKANAVYVRFSNKPVACTKKLDDMRYIDYDSNNDLIGIELLGVNGGVNVDDLPEQHEIIELLEKSHIKVFA